MCGFKTFETDEDPREFLTQILKKQQKGKTVMGTTLSGKTKLINLETVFEQEIGQQNNNVFFFNESQKDLNKFPPEELEKMKEAALRHVMRTKVSNEDKEKEKDAALHRAASLYIQQQKEEEKKLLQQILT